jgi:hypothetical protein
MAKHVSKTELNEAAPVESPEEVVRTAIEEVSAPKTSRKAKLKAATLVATEDSAPNYAALGVREDQVEKYEELRLRFNELGRLDTAQVFKRGEVVAELHELAPDQKDFTKRAKIVLKLSRRGAENYGAVYRNLAAYRERLVKAGMIASGLYDLAIATPEQVEEVLAAREAGQELSGKQIKQMLGKEPPSAVPDDGGPAGLRAATAEKIGYATKSLFDTLHGMLRDAYIALEPLQQGRNVAKGEAISALMHPARLASGLVKSLVFAAQILSEKMTGVIHIKPVGENRWLKLYLLLDVVGDGERWPAKEKVATWLSATIVPELEWAVGEERAAKARAVLDERAAAAEAERKKAEEAKVREKAEAKKAREKAKIDKERAEKRELREAKAMAKLAASKANAGGADEGTVESGLGADA